jgi:probable F420-dependent oxidoreductase
VEHEGGIWSPILDKCVEIAYDRRMALASSAVLTVGIHVPQAGPAASPQSLVRAARLAEELGYSDVWVSDHLVVPDNVEYPPSPYVFEALTTMTWLAAFTRRVRIGSSVLVLPMRNPVETGKMLATIDQLSSGRVLLGAAAGWLEPEFNALGVPFAERSARMNEALDIMTSMWTEDHITRTFPAHGISFESIRAKPQPVGRIPIWIGGRGAPALRRAVERGDGWHGDFISPDDVAPYVRFLRERRPEESFTISMRTRWDGLIDDHDELLRLIDTYREQGVNHIVAEPSQRTVDDYLRSIESLRSVFEKAGAQLHR